MIEVSMARSVALHEGVCARVMRRNLARTIGEPSKEPMSSALSFLIQSQNATKDADAYWETLKEVAKEHGLVLEALGTIGHCLREPTPEEQLAQKR